MNKRLKAFIISIIFILIILLSIQIIYWNRPIRIIPFNATYGQQFKNSLQDTFVISYTIGKSDSIRESFYLVEGPLKVDTGVIKDLIVNFIDSSKSFYKIFSTKIRSQVWFYKTSWNTNRNFTQDEENRIPNEDGIAELDYHSPNHCTLIVSIGYQSHLFSLNIDSASHQVNSAVYWKPN